MISFRITNQNVNITLLTSVIEAGYQNDLDNLQQFTFDDDSITVQQYEPQSKKSRNNSSDDLLPLYECILFIRVYNYSYMTTSISIYFFVYFFRSTISDYFNIGRCLFRQEIKK